ncbi:MAG: hypothetical protein R2932_36635 [Caldilineaceae bacterium]
MGSKRYPNGSTRRRHNNGRYTPVPTLDGSALVQQQIDTQIEEFLQSMSPEERVGQLFVITFDGNTVVPTSDIAELIHDYHIGSVMLAPKKENYTNAKGTNTPAEIAALANQLQALAYGYYLPRNRALALTKSDPVIAGALTMTETLSQTLSTTLELTELPYHHRPPPTVAEVRQEHQRPTTARDVHSKSNLIFPC